MIRVSEGAHKMSFYQSSLDRLIGQTGVVTNTIPADHVGSGVIKVAGQLWSAQTEWPHPILPDALVIIVGRTGLRLEVFPEGD